MAEWTEEILNNCEKTYCVKIGFKGAINIVAFTTTYEDAERIINEFIQGERRAVIEEYSNTDITFRIDVKGA